MKPPKNTYTLEEISEIIKFYEQFKTTKTDEEKLRAMNDAENQIDQGKDEKEDENEIKNDEVVDPVEIEEAGKSMESKRLHRVVPISKASSNYTHYSNEVLMIITAILESRRQPNKKVSTCIC